MEKLRCEFCDRMISIKGMHTHVVRSHGTIEEKAKYSAGNHGKYSSDEYKNKASEKAKAYWMNKKLPNVNCQRCGSLFKISKSRQLESGNYFCSKRCASSRPKTQNTKDKIRKRIIELNGGITELKNCSICGHKVKKSINSFCSKKCFGISRTQSCDWKNSLKEYRIRSKFTFSLNEYPDEFDFKLIQNHGWYKASNRGNNLTGISRDHLYSVKEGFENNVDPLIVAHPANCRLVLHTVNISKNSKSLLTLNDLLDKIEKWDKKYK